MDLGLAGRKAIVCASTAGLGLEEALVLHYWTPLALARAVLPGMRQRAFGRIVNITSAMVAAPRQVQIPSAGARTALTAVMKGLAREVASDGVTINQILPERVGEPSELGAACAFLCSVQAGYINGTNLRLDGGNYLGLI